MKDEQVVRRPYVAWSVEGVTALVLSVTVFAVFAGAVVTGFLPIPHI